MLRNLTFALATTAALSLGFAAPALACDGDCCKNKDKAKAAAEAEAPADAPTDVAEAEGKLAAQPGAQVGDKTICPVMGSEFEVTADSPSAEHEGQQVFFCCPGCGDAFAKDPAGLLAQVNEKIAEKNAAE